MKTIQVRSLVYTKNSELPTLLENMSEYDDDSVIRMILEIKKRNLPLNEAKLQCISEFAKNNGYDSLEGLEADFFQRNEVENYQEYYNKSLNIIPISDEERLRREKERRILNAKIAESEQKQASNDVLYGALWFIGGSLVTIISLSNGHGGIIAYGAIIFGGMQLIKGLTKI